MNIKIIVPAIDKNYIRENFPPTKIIQTFDVTIFSYEKKGQRRAWPVEWVKQNDIDIATFSFPGSSDDMVKFSYYPYHKTPEITEVKISDIGKIIMNLKREGF